MMLAFLRHFPILKTFQSKHALKTFLGLQWNISIQRDH